MSQRIDALRARLAQSRRQDRQSPQRKPEHTNPATIEEFEREQMGIAAKE